jgi:hypothetical protein
MEPGSRGDYHTPAVCMKGMKEMKTMKKARGFTA